MRAGVRVRAHFTAPRSWERFSSATTPHQTPATCGTRAGVPNLPLRYDGECRASADARKSWRRRSPLALLGFGQWPNEWSAQRGRLAQTTPRGKAECPEYSQPGSPPSAVADSSSRPRGSKTRSRCSRQRAANAMNHTTCGRPHAPHGSQQTTRATRRCYANAACAARHVPECVVRGQPLIVRIRTAAGWAGAGFRADPSHDMHSGPSFSSKKFVPSCESRRRRARRGTGHAAVRQP